MNIHKPYVDFAQTLNILSAVWYLEFWRSRAQLQASLWTIILVQSTTSTKKDSIEIKQSVTYAWDQ
jgi:hypothetical protein